MTKNNKVTQYFEENIQRAKIHIQKDKTNDNPSINDKESSSSDNRNNSDEKPQGKQINRKITLMTILLQKRMSEV